MTDAEMSITFIQSERFMKEIYYYGNALKVNVQLFMFISSSVNHKDHEH